MKERLSWFEPAKDSLRSVLEAALRTRTVVYNKAYDLGPDVLITAGIGVIAGGLLNGGATLYAAVHSPLSRELFGLAIAYAEITTVASVVFGIDLMRYDIEHRRTHLP